MNTEQAGQDGWIWFHFEKAGHTWWSERNPWWHTSPAQHTLLNHFDHVFVEGPNLRFVAERLEEMLGVPAKVWMEKPHHFAISLEHAFKLAEAGDEDALILRINDGYPTINSVR